MQHNLIKSAALAAERASVAKKSWENSKVVAWKTSNESAGESEVTFDREVSTYNEQAAAWKTVREMETIYNQMVELADEARELAGTRESIAAHNLKYDEWLRPLHDDCGRLR